MNPPQSKFLTFRPLFMWDTTGTFSLDSQGEPYLAPTPLSSPAPFKVPGITLPYLYHAGTAWGLSGTNTAPTDGSSFNVGSNGGIFLGFRAFGSLRPWGVAGYFLRSPRSVIVVTDNCSTGDDADAILSDSTIGSNLDAAGASCVVCTPDNGVSSITNWAPRNLDRTGFSAPTTDSPIAASCWLAGELLVVNMSSDLFMGHCLLGLQTDLAGAVSAGWELHDVNNGINSTDWGIAIDRPGISVARGYWSTLTARCAKLGVVHLYDPFTGSDSMDPTVPTMAQFDAGYSASTLFTDITDSLSPAWSRTSVTNLRQSPGNANTQIASAIASFWP